jgi:hypothetical protein
LKEAQISAAIGLPPILTTHAWLLTRLNELGCTGVGEATAKGRYEEQVALREEANAILKDYNDGCGEGSSVGTRCRNPKRRPDDGRSSLGQVLLPRL